MKQAVAVDIDDRVMNKLKKQDIRSAMNDWSSGSSSSSDSGSGSGSSEEESDSEAFGGVGDIAAAATSLIPEGQETRRLAVLHLDWDRISAKDIFAMLYAAPPFFQCIIVTFEQALLPAAQPHPGARHSVRAHLPPM